MILKDKKPLPKLLLSSFSVGRLLISMQPILTIITNNWFQWDSFEKTKLFFCEWLSVGNSFRVGDGGPCPLIPSALSFQNFFTEIDSNQQTIGDLFRLIITNIYLLWIEHSHSDRWNNLVLFCFSLLIMLLSTFSMSLSAICNRESPVMPLYL